MDKRFEKANDIPSDVGSESVNQDHDLQNDLASEQGVDLNADTDGQISSKSLDKAMYCDLPPVPDDVQPVPDYVCPIENPKPSFEEQHPGYTITGGADDYRGFMDGFNNVGKPIEETLEESDRRRRNMEAETADNQPVAGYNPDLPEDQVEDDE